MKETLLFTLKPGQETQYNEKLPSGVFFYLHLKTLYFSLSSSLFLYLKITTAGKKKPFNGLHVSYAIKFCYKLM